MTTRDVPKISVPVLARAESEGGLEILVADGRVTEARFKLVRSHEPCIACAAHLLDLPLTAGQPGRSAS